MLTRLKVSGFKNLVDVDVRFGPVTCIAGMNGVGKSNLFDAITFLSALADRRPLIDAARSVRAEDGRSADVRSLFQRAGDDYAPEMTFDAEMIVPGTGYDDLGQEAVASITFLRYTLSLAYRLGESTRSLGSLEILQERLVHINKGEAKQFLPFPHDKQWRQSVITGRRAGGDFISTEGTGSSRTIKLHQDRGSGRPRSFLAASLPRTVLSETNAAESPTALLARKEMQSWKLLQLEPSRLRMSDTFTAPVHLGPDGSHLAATLFHLASSPHSDEKMSSQDAEEAESNQVYAQVANRLADLISDVSSVWVDRDSSRELLTVHLTDRHGTSHPARALSDGTLRFLALAVLEIDPGGEGVLCLEEPENGIHPARIPAMLKLLSDLAVDVNMPVGPDNTLRQVIINTHSPAVVSEMPEDDLLLAKPVEVVRDGHRYNGVRFCWLTDTWRAKADDDPSRTVAKGDLLAYLNPVIPREPHGASPNENNGNSRPGAKRRVVDRPDLQPLVWQPMLLPVGDAGNR
jgi:predicted ATPase